MSNNEAQKFPPEVWKLFDKYVHGAISRREFIDGAGAFAVAGMSGAAILDALNPKFAEAQQIAPTDSRIKTEYVEIPAPGYGKLRGYLVKPASAKGKLPTVLVVHENRGLQSSHRGCGPPGRAGELHRLRAGCVVSARRLSRR